MKKLLLGLILLFPSLPISAQNDAPYLYYFDPDQRAFIVEQADGRDRHLLAEEMMPEEVRSVAGPGWSPSGKFLAWQGILGRIQIHEATFLPYALNVETEKSVTELDIFEQTTVLAWHPTRDWLLAAGLIDGADDGFGRKIIRVALIDAASDTTIAAHNSELFVMLAPYYYWQPDGVTFSWPQSEARTFLRLNQNGVTEFERPVTNYTVSPEGQLVFDTGNGSWAVENLNARQTTFQEGTVPDLCCVEWAGSRGLIVDEGLWLLDSESANVTLIAEELEYRATFQSGNWTRGLGSSSNLWSPDGQHFAYLTSNQDLMVSDGVISNLIWENVVSWGWVDAETILVALFDAAAPVFMEISITGERLTPPLDESEHPVWFSSTKRQAAGFTYDGPWIMDFAAEKTMNLPRHSAVESNADYGGEILWHDSGEWLVITETPFVSMMGDDPALNTVIRADGALRRELPNCFVLCVEWLPDRVNIQNLPESD
jgi:hypothetical protein